MPYGVWAVLHRKFSAPWPCKNSSLCFTNKRSVPRNRVQVPSVFAQDWAHAPDIPRGAWSQSFGSQSTHVPSFSQVPQIYAAMPPGLYIHPLYLFHFRSVTVFRFVTYIKWEVQVCLSRADYYIQHRRRIFHKGQKRHKFLRVPGKTFVYLKDIILSKKRIPKELSGNCRSPRDYIYIVTRRWTLQLIKIS